MVVSGHLAIADSLTVERMNQLSGVGVACMRDLRRFQDACCKQKQNARVKFQSHRNLQWIEVQRKSVASLRRADRGEGFAQRASILAERRLFEPVVTRTQPFTFERDRLGAS